MTPPLDLIKQKVIEANQAKKVDNHSYYYFNSDYTMGYVSKTKMNRMIKGWGWKRTDFIKDTEIFKHGLRLPK